MTHEQKFLQALKDVFIGAPVEGESGYINLMRIKARYFEQGIAPRLQADVRAALTPFPTFREELFDKLYSFFHRYFSESGSIYFRYTPLHQNVYARVYTDDRDVMLFWKTHMLYYVKTDRLFQNMEIKVDNFTFYFDVSTLQHKQSNEKRALVFDFAEKRADDALVFTVTYSERGSKTKMADIQRALRATNTEPREEVLERAFRLFERQSEVDYFINKDARAFLREQFDLWMYQYVFSEEGTWTAIRVQQLQVLRDIAYKLIDFIAQFEDELVKVWNKPKFVRGSHYVITLDRIAAAEQGDAVLRRVLAHPGMTAQLGEWRELGMVGGGFTPEDAWQRDLFGQRVDDAYQYLPIDTRYFPDLELDILALFDDLDEVLDGWLVHSENYQALRTLEPKFKESVQAIYIDPPFNLEANGDFLYSVKYKDSTWTTILENRVQLARDLLSPQGSIFVRCDYNGNMLVRLLLNGIFGEANFGNEIIINRFRRQLRGLKNFNVATDSLFYYSKSDVPYFQEQMRSRLCSFCGQEIDPNWRGMSSPGLRHPPERVILGRELLPPDGRHWTFTQDRIEQMEAEERIRINDKLSFTDLEGNRIQGLPEYLQTEDTPVDSVWTDLKGYVFGASFPTENPEELLQRAIEVASPKQALIMDFFLGSGTTIATAHKLGRKWLGVEMGEHFDTIVMPRMKRVLSGEKSGISKDVNWQGGGFFKYYRLEQYEDALRLARYEDADLFHNPYADPYSSYVFLRDLKMLEAVDLDTETESVTVHLERLYPDIDLAETLSCVTGKPIQRITAEAVEFRDGTRADLVNPEWGLVKPLIWW
ncbi:MAG TPA: site-specific DNA-methyltransferase [Anaerolineae bacterium]|nr:site-specific DNA-methyltransferase [Anaerolineae bacterium]HQI83366.1 site-specific DNA-methyltransferase [Anaerolineae bacterium]